MPAFTVTFGSSHCTTGPLAYAQTNVVKPLSFESTLTIITETYIRTETRRSGLTVIKFLNRGHQRSRLGPKSPTP